MNKTVGIIGGGQLGLMLGQAAHKLGFKVAILESNPECPAASIADTFIQGSFKNKEDVLKLADVSDYITFEIEGANSDALAEIASAGTPVYPSGATLKIIKDKFNQKVFLRKHNIAVADFALIETIEDCKEQGNIFGYPFLLKARFDAYDGRGNYVVKNVDEIEKAYVTLSKSPLYVEKFVPFVKEVAVVSVRDTHGTIQSFPVVETIHKNNICHIVRSPANISIDIKVKAEELAKNVLDVLSDVGVFAVEMFVTDSGEVLVNEIAPRVHNSGHHTIEAFTASQFEQHIRAVTGLPVTALEPTSLASVMVNILGEREGDAQLQGVDEAKALGGVEVHIYGKLQTRNERKMGHITVVGSTIEEAEEKALKARKTISI